MLLLFLNEISVDEDEDDLNDDDIPGFTHPGVTTQVDKGKGKAHEPEQLAPPSNVGGPPSSGLSGNIGSSVDGTMASSRQTVGGLRVETRYAFSTTTRLSISPKAETLVLTRWTNLYQKLLCVHLANIQEECIDAHAGSRPFLHLREAGSSPVPS